MLQLPWLDPDNIAFPETTTALDSPNGLLAAGGQLTPQWLLQAYTKGIFPWFSEDEPILWWSPSPRTVIYIDQLHVSKSLAKAIRKTSFDITFDTHFAEVVSACAQARPNQEGAGTWISQDILHAYTELHHLGHAHSVEVWSDGELIGGVYGIALGRMFFGESMFSFRSNSSKIALFHLVEKLKEWQYVAIDCQVHNDHLESLGAVGISRVAFESLIQEHVQDMPCHWQADDLLD
jgi:leucyl/phenylalanyl-tRNA--protein transferase